MFPNDFKELLFAFNNRNVKYLVIGGYAVMIHSQPRATKDLDVLLGPGIENAEAAYAALADFGAPLEGLRPTDLIEPDTFFRMGTPPLMVDILFGIKGVDFDSAWERRMEIDVDNRKVSIISSDDLIQSKLAAGRPMDLLDVDAIRQTQQLQEIQIEPELEQEREQENERDRGR